MTQKLRQNTAVTVTIDGVILADGLTPADALTIVQTDITLTKNGAFIGSKNESSGSANISPKSYAVLLDATDTDTLGRLKIDLANNDTIPPVYANFEVVSQAKYDADIVGPVTVALLDASLATFFDGVTYTYAQTQLISDCWSRGLVARVTGDDTSGTGTITLAGVVISYTYAAGSREVTGITGV